MISSRSQWCSPRPMRWVCPIGRVLQAQADEMRDKRRQRAREKAAKVPVKILFPLALCFLPAILIIVLGPIVGPIKHAFHQAELGAPERRQELRVLPVAAPLPQSGCDCRLRLEAYNDLGIPAARGGNGVAPDLPSGAE